MRGSSRSLSRARSNTLNSGGVPMSSLAAVYSTTAAQQAHAAQAGNEGMAGFRV